MALWYNGEGCRARWRPKPLAQCQSARGRWAGHHGSI